MLGSWLCWVQSRLGMTTHALGSHCEHGASCMLKAPRRRCANAAVEGHLSRRGTLRSPMHSHALATDATILHRLRKRTICFKLRAAYKGRLRGLQAASAAAAGNVHGTNQGSAINKKGRMLWRIIQVHGFSGQRRVASKQCGPEKGGHRNEVLKMTSCVWLAWPALGFEGCGPRPALPHANQEAGREAGWRFRTPLRHC